MIDKQEAINSVKNYEIAIESDYLFNQVRFKKTNSISLRSLEEAFPIWTRMALKLESVLVESYEEGYEDEEEFNPDQSFD
jgi:hypothetical protein